MIAYSSGNFARITYDNATPSGVVQNYDVPFSAFPVPGLYQVEFFNVFDSVSSNTLLLGAHDGSAYLGTNLGIGTVNTSTYHLEVQLIKRASGLVIAYVNQNVNNSPNLIGGGVFSTYTGAATFTPWTQGSIRLRDALGAGLQVAASTVILLGPTA